MPNYFNPYQQQYFQPNMYQPQAQPQAQPQQNQQQIQNGGFMPAPNEAFARNYPVAPGNSVTFMDENAPYVYTKTKGFSQLDQPIIKKYKLIEEQVESDAPTVNKEENNLKPLNNAINDIKDEIELLWDEIEEMKNASTKKTPRRKDDNGGDD